MAEGQSMTNNQIMLFFLCRNVQGGYTYTTLFLFSVERITRRSDELDTVHLSESGAIQRSEDFCLVCTTVWYYFTTRPSKGAACWAAW